jgi:hypothetical protein
LKKVQESGILIPSTGERDQSGALKSTYICLILISTFDASVRIVDRNIGVRSAGRFIHNNRTAYTISVNFFAFAIQGAWSKLNCALHGKGGL